MAGLIDTIRPMVARLWDGNNETKAGITTGTLEQLLRFGVGSGSSSKSGQAVTVNTALQVTTVLACARVKAEGLAQVPCRLFKRTSDGGRVEATDHPLHRILYRRPNDWQTAFEFREQIGFHLALCGNAYIFKVMDGAGKLLELLPYEPGSVTVVRDGDFALNYKLRSSDGRQFDVPASSIWHIRGASWNGYEGMETISLARNAIGLALASEEFGSELFGNGARPSGILSTDQALSPEVANAIKASWTEANTGSGNRLKTALMQGGLKWQSIAQTANEAQFTESRKHQVVEICRAMRVLPIMAMHQDGTAAYASVEQMFLAHLTHTLGPDFERFEQSAEVNLLSEADQKAGYYVELVESGLMRGTAKDRAETMAIVKQNGAATGNEFRDAMDLPRGTDPDLNEYTPAVNLYGLKDPADPVAAGAEPADPATAAMDD